MASFDRLILLHLEGDSVEDVADAGLVDALADGASIRVDADGSKVAWSVEGRDSQSVCEDGSAYIWRKGSRV